MMIRINSMRFQNIVNNYIEILNDLEEDYYLYDTLKEDDKFYKQVSNSFRNNMKEMYTIFEDYLAFSLSSVGVAVTDKKLRDYILNAFELKIIPEDFYEFYNKTLNIRNTFAHQYKKPTTKELIKLYIFSSLYGFSYKSISQLKNGFFSTKVTTGYTSP